MCCQLAEKFETCLPVHHLAFNIKIFVLSCQRFRLAVLPEILYIVVWSMGLSTILKILKNISKTGRKLSVFKSIC